MEEILNCDHSNDTFQAVLSCQCGAVNVIIQVKSSEQ